MKQSGRHIIFLVDNTPLHIFDQSKLTHVRVEFLDPNMTSHIQPLDAGIIHAFKAMYRWLYCSMMLDNDKNGKDNIYRIDQLHGMRLALCAWDSISSSTVADCWWHTGIINPNGTAATGIATDDNISHTEKELLEELAKLVDLEMVTAQNCVSIQEFMGVDGEKTMEDTWSIEDHIEQQQLDA
jgi:hypothetical protein